VAVYFKGIRSNTSEGLNSIESFKVGDEVEECETIVGYHFQFQLLFQIESFFLAFKYIHVHAHSFWLVPKSHFLVSLHFTDFSRCLSLFLLFLPVHLFLHSLFPLLFISLPKILLFF